jgi:hypothetical protein
LGWIEGGETALNSPDAYTEKAEKKSGLQIDQWKHTQKKKKKLR